MKKLTALIVVLLGLTLLPSCQGMDAEDLEPTTVEVVVEDQHSEGDDEPKNHGSGGNG